MRFHLFLREVLILGDQYPTASPCKIPDTPVIGSQQSRLPDRRGRQSLVSKPPRQSRGQLRIHQEAHGSGCRKDRMIRVPGSKGDRGSDILCFKIRKIPQNLLLGGTSGKHLKNILHANTHSPDAGTSSALGGIRGYSLHRNTTTPPPVPRQPLPRHPPYIHPIRDVPRTAQQPAA
jgi:hypothetical protein